MQTFRLSVLHTLCLLLVGIVGIPTYAREVADTLKSEEKDQVIVVYDFIQEENLMSITIKDFRKRLGSEHKKRFSDYENNRIVGLIFDRKGAIPNYKITGMTPEPLNPGTMEYEKSSEGVFILQAGQTTSFSFRNGLDDNNALVRIPIYLAYYKEKRNLPLIKRQSEYEIFTYCGDLQIKWIEKKNHPSQGVKWETREQIVTKTEQVEIEVDEELTAEEQATMLMESIRKKILQAKQNDIDSEIKELHKLENMISELEKIQYKTKLNDRITNLINETITEYNETVSKAEEGIRIRDEKIEQQKKTREAKNQLKYVKEQTNKIKHLSEADRMELKIKVRMLAEKRIEIEEYDYELAEQMKEASETAEKEIRRAEIREKRRKIWLTIGLVILGIILVVANQLFQQYRNTKNNERLMKQQEEMARQAEDKARRQQNDAIRKAQEDAKRRAESIARSGVNRVQGQIRQKSREALRDGMKNILGGNKFTRI